MPGQTLSYCEKHRIWFEGDSCPIRSLESALTPFATMARSHPEAEDDLLVTIKLGLLRKADQALASLEYE